MRYIALLIGLVFLLFTYWQFNDPDPVWWITVYLVSAYCSYQAFMGRFNTELLAVLAVLYAAGTINAWLQMSAWEGFFTEGSGLSMKTVNQELARESAGLGICLFAMLLYLLIGWASRRKTVV
jgi:Transmembrane family 220, helix